MTEEELLNILHLTHWTRWMFAILIIYPLTDYGLNINKILSNFFPCLLSKQKTKMFLEKINCDRKVKNVTNESNTKKLFTKLLLLLKLLIKKKYATWGMSKDLSKGP